ncbi:MAG: hypothetical protein IKB02_03330 [Clostridia bacterium]|nr:hypothetical protein [Clostridia bacterium]
MKRIICFLLAVMMLITLVACGNTPDDNVDESTKGEETTAPVIAEKIPAEKYDGVFKAGYASVDITPTKLPIAKKSGGSYKKVQDKLYATCVAVNDGKNTALLITVDVTSIGNDICENFKKYITNATKVPAENIIISATHTHTAPSPGLPKGDTASIRWLADLNTAMANVAKEAIADLSDAEIHNGTTEVKGMAFVRRGYSADGTPAGIWRQKSTNDFVRYESEADNSIQIIRFVRADKKDILMANLQTHFTEAGNYITDTISSDLAGVIKGVVEIEDEDALFAVYVGASGNINTVAYVEGTKVFGNYSKMGKAVAEAIVATPLTKVEAGTIQTTEKQVKTNVRKEDDETVKKAQQAQAEIEALNAYDGDAEVYAIAAKYGFESAKEVSFTVSRNTGYDATRKHTIIGISFGDLAFVAVPYEMFDTNGMEVKNGSPFNMTFVITNAGGAGAYVPSALAVPNGGYEVYTAVDEFGTGEKMVSEYLAILREHKGIK